MKTTTILLIFVVLASALFISGCTQSTIKSSEQASEAVSNISNDVSGVSGTLEDIDNILTGDGG